MRIISIVIFHLSKLWKPCSSYCVSNISGEAARGNSWNWLLLGVKGSTGRTIRDMLCTQEQWPRRCTETSHRPYQCLGFCFRVNMRLVCKIVQSASGNHFQYSSCVKSTGTPYSAYGSADDVYAIVLLVPPRPFEFVILITNFAKEKQTNQLTGQFEKKWHS